MSLARAIEQLEAEVAAFNQGTMGQPEDNSADWFLLRAKSLGLSSLKRMQQLELSGQPAAAERYYREAVKLHKTAEVPEEVIVEREVSPTSLIERV